MKKTIAFQRLKFKIALPFFIISLRSHQCLTETSLVSQWDIVSISMRRCQCLKEALLMPQRVRYAIKRKPPGLLRESRRKNLLGEKDKVA